MTKPHLALVDKRWPKGWPNRPLLDKSKRAHPLYARWKYLKSKGRDQVWDDFDRFVADVGLAPSPTHKMLRKDKSRPWEPGNVIWLDAICPPGERNETLLKRSWRSRNSHKFRDQHLRSKFGITEADYQTMAAAQGYVCAICEGAEHGASLAVDHCHETGVIRGLLCRGCNVSLGCFRDSEAILLRAIEYLREGREMAARK